MNVSLKYEENEHKLKTNAYLLKWKVHNNQQIKL